MGKDFELWEKELFEFMGWLDSIGIINAFLELDYMYNGPLFKNIEEQEPLDEL